jgi:hypothetical protein
MTSYEKDNTKENVQADQQNPRTARNVVRFPVFSVNKCDEKKKWHWFV